MSTVLSDTPRTTSRKRRHCYYCGQRIEPGEIHGKRAGVDSGDFWTMRFHPECDAAAADWTPDEYECHYPGDVPRPMTAFDPCI